MGETLVIGTKSIQNTFQPRLLKYRFIGGLNQNGKPVFLSKTNDNSRLLTSYKSEVSIRVYGGMTLAQATINIYNMPMDLARKISTIGMYSQQGLTSLVKIEIYASLDQETADKEPVFTKIFSGGIVVSYADLNAQPDPYVRIEAQVLGGETILPLESISFNGDVLATDVLNGIIKNYHKKYDAVHRGIVKVENKGVHTSLHNPNYHGSFVNQLQTLAHDANFEMTFHGDVLYIYPPDADIQFSPYLVSAGTGMIGYPSYSGNGIIIDSLFIPTLTFGQKIKIHIPINEDTKEFAPLYNGIWNYMVSMTHELSCNSPNGSWKTRIEMAKQNIKGSINNGIE